MATQFEIDCAVMAGRAYQLSRADINWFPIPNGWSEFFHVPNPTYAVSSGFEAVSFQRGNDIVIAFAGTAELNDWPANAGLALGGGSDQLLQAARYYCEVRAANPNANISFTGHSLGGGLAALLGVFFDRPAVTFDQAPFRNSATTQIRDALLSYLGSNGITGSVLQPLQDFTDLSSRVGRVSGYFVSGEFLHVLPPFNGFSGIGTLTPLTHGAAAGNSIDLHAQSLLTAFLQNDGFRRVTDKLTALVGMLFDSALYKFDTGIGNTQNTSFLEHLIRHQVGNLPGIAVRGDKMLDRFTADLQLLAQDGGVTLSDGSASNPDLNDASRALTAFAMQMYYANPAAADAGKRLFADSGISGGIRFDRQDVAASLDQAKGYTQYFQRYLGTLFSADGDRAVIEAMLPALRDWYVQAGAGGMTAADTQNRGAFLLGGMRADNLTGGTRADLLIGQDGDDFLAGGNGADILLGGNNDDRLLGGLGADEYRIGRNQGFDIITDFAGDGSGGDGQGSIVYAGQALGGSLTADAGDPQRWRDSRGLDYRFTGTWGGRGLLTITDPAAVGGNAIQLRNWQSGELGLSLAPPLAIAKSAKNGDDGDNILAADSANQRVFGFAGADRISLGLAGAEGWGGAGDDWIGNGDGEQKLYGEDGDDVLVASGGNDELYGGIGNDALQGGADDDLLEGDDGADWLAGGAGNDALFGGGGDDRLESRAGSDELGGDEGNDTLSGGTETAAGSGVWASADGKYRCTRIAEADSSQTLVDLTPEQDDRILVKGFQSGRLGLQLDEAEPLLLPPVVTGNAMVLEDTKGNRLRRRAA